MDIITSWLFLLLLLVLAGTGAVLIGFICLHYKEGDKK